MKNIATAIKFEKGDTNDNLCKIHHSLHMSYILAPNISMDKIKREDKYIFNYKKPQLEEIPQDIFKPPTFA